MCDRKRVLWMQHLWKSSKNDVTHLYQVWRYLLDKDVHIL
jgi:hypothetical protein